MIIYDNFKKLIEERVNLAVELLDKCTPGEWMDEEIYCYEDLEEFAEYELYDGWYTGWFDTEKYKPSYFKGAPNPFDYIDLKELGELLCLELLGRKLLLQN
ncbi:hypothetical protein AB9M75_10800 [Lactobacillus sp. AN1001]